jgi:hypothetical protein
MRHALAPKTCKLASILGGSGRSTDFSMASSIASAPSEAVRCVGTMPCRSLPIHRPGTGKTSRHLKCTKCGAMGYVDTRLNWSEVIDFHRADGRLVKPEDG